MFSLSDLYILRRPMAEEAQRLLPVPATVSFAVFAADGSVHPLDQALAMQTGAASPEEATISREPGMLGNQLVLPLDLPSGECVAVLIGDVDPALLRKMSGRWLREVRATLLQELELVHWGYIDPEADLYNRRAAMTFLQENPEGAPAFFLLLNTTFYRRTAAGNIQKLREIADLLQALTRMHCFSFGYGVFGVLLSAENREQAMKTTHYLQRQLKQEGLTRVQIGFAQVSGSDCPPAANVLDRLWRALALAEKRGPFGLCDIDTIDERFPHPFQLRQPAVLARLKQRWRGLPRFTLVLAARQEAGGQPAKGMAWPDSMPLAGLSTSQIDFLGEEEHLALFILPEADAAATEEAVAAIRAHFREHCGKDSLAVGVASWPCLDYVKSAIPGNCLKALLHGSFLGPETTTVFDHVSLNVSGDFFFEEGDYRAAIREYRRGLRLQPSDPNLVNSLGVTLVECGQERQAAICFQEVLAKEPANYMALVNLGHVQQTLGQGEKALECFERAYRLLAQSKASPQELLLPLGKLYAERGDHAKALKVFEHWRGCPGSDREFLLFRLLGQAYWQNGRGEEAVRACQRALQLFPQDSISLSTLGLLYVEQGEGNDIGLTLCRKALALDNFNPDHWCRLGSALLHVGNRTEAGVAVRQSLQLQRDHVEGLLLAGRLNVLGKKLTRAKQCFNQAMNAKACTPSQAERARADIAELTAS
ncbi:MAG: tetratricopeptide repeat protein [Desulfobulbus sp.]|jgi:tetratricopeptide (TPR) repeat protein|uniref:tetratricopeptide repeat-containing diguanylate cyclase n=1 Tax=Desulfobulbus sp. TaxID=895 RepID=UPI00284E3461|nr:tetratricopeptide repeat protein [Desulfobulbus sp.]MDR2549954.1 tetratricopeptide repeat protein [Desulfobulbus sp.]